MNNLDPNTQTSEGQQATEQGEVNATESAAQTESAEEGGVEG